MKYKNNSLSLYFLKKLVLSNRSASLIRRITLISFFTITLSLTAFFIILFVMNGMNRNIKNRIMALEPHLTTIHKPSENAEVLKTLGGTYASYIGYQNLDLILKTIDGQFRGGAAVGYSTVGLNTWSKQVVNLKNQTHQKSYEDFDTELKLDLNEVAIGIDLARSLGVLEGDEVTLIPPETLLLSSLEAPTLQKVTVRKIISTSLQDLDTKLILFNSELSLINFKSTLSFQSGFHVWFKNVDDADSIVKSLQIKSIASSTWKEKNSDLFFALKLEKLMIGIFLGLAGLIASSSILTVLALLMSQKKRDIAIIKTLGLSENKTLWVFTKIGLWISGTAIILGSVLGIGISLYIEYNPVNILPHIYYDALVPSFVDFYFAGWVFLVSVLLAFLGSYFPAKATLKIQPALLLKQKN